MPESLIANAGGGPLAGPELNERLEQQVFAPARSIGVDLPLTAVTAPPPPVEIKRSPKGTWWLASTFDADPVAVSNGGFTKAPPEVVAELRTLRAAGVDFEYVYVLHELPGDWTPGTPPPKMRLAGSASSGAASVVKMQEAVFVAGFEALRATVKATGVAARGLAMAGAAVAVGAAEAVAFDPVILGGVRDPESDRVAWVTLAVWDEVPS